jgi:hypothetical protein
MATAATPKSVRWLPVASTTRPATLGPTTAGRLHGHRRQAGVRAKLRVRTEVEHQGEDIDQHERAAEPGYPEDHGIGPGRGHPHGGGPIGDEDQEEP